MSTLSRCAQKEPEIKPEITPQRERPEVFPQKSPEVIPEPEREVYPTPEHPEIYPEPSPDVPPHEPPPEIPSAQCYVMHQSCLN